jgi:hypothetical protein
MGSLTLSSCAARLFFSPLPLCQIGPSLVVCREYFVCTFNGVVDREAGACGGQVFEHVAA